MNVSFVPQPILYVNLQTSLALHIGLVLSKSLSYLFLIDGQYSPMIYV